LEFCNGARTQTSRMITNKKCDDMFICLDIISTDEGQTDSRQICHNYIAIATVFF